MRDDIVGGLRNALDKGATLEEAMRSFINAGYTEAEVREAATAVQPSGLAVTAVPQVQKKSMIPLLNVSSPANSPLKPLPANEQIRQPTYQKPQQLPQTNVQLQNKPKRPLPWLAISLVSILLILVVTLIFSIIYQDQIILYIKRLMA